MDVAFFGGLAFGPRRRRETSQQTRLVETCMSVPESSKSAVCGPNVSRKAPGAPEGLGQMAPFSA